MPPSDPPSGLQMPATKPPLESALLLPEDIQRKVQAALPDFAELFEENGERLASAQVRNAFKVAHLEDSRRDYYLVPIFSDADQPYFVAQVSAHTGTILSMEGIRSVVPESESWLYAALSEDELEAQLAACSKEYIPRSWQSTGRLVWRHCLQSQSPYEPFHEVRRGEEIAWLDVHGKLHRKLDFPRRRDSGPRPDQRPPTPQ